MGGKVANADDLVARIAARQHGVVSLAQLEYVGMGPGALRLRVQRGRLHRVHRGVYAVGHRGLSREGRWLAAVLALGDGAALSHDSAAALWGLLPAPPVVHVTVPGRSGRAPRAGVRVHNSVTLTVGQTTRRLNIPVTTPARTLADLRRTAPRERLAAALRQAGVLGVPLAGDLEPDGTRSELEARFIRICRRHRLPLPQVNRRVAGMIVDFLWPTQRLIVELDGFRFHRSRAAFETDRARDLELGRLGYEVIRLTWRLLDEDPARIASVLRTLLGRPRHG